MRKKDALFLGGLILSMLFGAPLGVCEDGAENDAAYRQDAREALVKESQREKNYMHRQLVHDQPHFQSPERPRLMELEPADTSAGEVAGV